RRGWRVRVHEQDADLRVLGAGIYIWENGLKVLEALDVLDATIDDALPVRRRERRGGDGRLIGAEPFGGPGARLYVPLRRALLTALAEGLRDAGGEIVFGSRMVRAEPDGVAHFAGGASAEADLVIGADGVNSPIRDGLGLLRRRRPCRQYGYRIMIPRRAEELATPEGSAICEHWNGSRRLLYAPSTADLAYVQLTAVAGDPAAGAAYDPETWLRTFPHLDWIVERIPHDGRGDWFERVSLHRWSRGRVAVLGDAATAQPPFLGQGGGLAMMAGLSLACHLEAAASVESGLAAWEAREKRLFTWVQAVSDGYGELARRPAWLRTAALKALGASGYLRRKTVRVAAMHEPTGSPMARPVSAVMPELHPTAGSPR
ncbi:MAG: NAD(P)/FAD-dependent oxidoreductase, partial [Alphaproteobacteria bacterium]